MLNIVPGMRVAAPRDAARLCEELGEALDITDGPTALRFPKGDVGEDIPALERRDGVDVLAVPADGLSDDVLLVAVGPFASMAKAVAERLRNQGIGVTVVDPRWVLPVPDAIARLAKAHKLVVTVGGQRRRRRRRFGRVGRASPRRDRRAMPRRRCAAGVPGARIPRRGARRRRPDRSEHRPPGDRLGRRHGQRGLRARSQPTARLSETGPTSSMDAELERWKDAGQYFDYLGFDVFYRTAGAGPTLLLIHGYPFNSWDWAPLWDRLTERFTVIAPDMLGMGFSDKPVAYEYTVADHADMHEALLARLGVDLRARAGPRPRRLGRPGVARPSRVRPARLRGAAHRIDHLAQRRAVQRDIHATAAAEGDVPNAVGGHHESAARQLTVAAADRTHHQRDVRAGHQAVAADARPVPPDPRVQRRQAGDAQGGQVRQRPLHPPQSVGAGDAARRRSRCG